MARLIKAVGPMEMRAPSDDRFAALVRSIMFQQLAGAAANAIHGRFLKLFADGLSPSGVLALPDGAMRSAGVSGSKAAAITDLAQKVDDGTVPLHDVDSLSDDELVARMVQVRRHRPVDRRDVPDVPAAPARCLAGGRLRRAERLGDRARAQSTAQAARDASGRREVSAVPVDRGVVLLASRGYRPARQARKQAEKVIGG